ncbi:hypothetical protein FBR07_03005 [Candidatus Uhrbacteria bacterium UHB]|jgi:hypothetical protein|uniref:Uncharacterized protein n=1 Tax=candidate division WWE3 bacterium TaxID=2053526 RepID=A0A928TR83_UNCKA|nr:hypothetical protein [candidate division WWE3 bacterium]MDL1953122.1 hypothetical protein [Candidatus Uhrbacteria bacterium UHB]RIL00422.1 MAG: hypothetical protein DCC77_02550 [Candidatus Uhrbacteria bacterium]
MEQHILSTFETCRPGDFYFVYIDQGIVFRLERVDASRCNPFICLEEVIPRDAEIGQTLRRCHALVLDVLNPLLMVSCGLRFRFAGAADITGETECQDVSKFLEDRIRDPLKQSFRSDASYRLYYELEECLP